MEKKLLLTGSSGKLGRAILKFSGGYRFLTPSSKDLDIRNHDKTDTFFRDHKIRYIIHAAALARLVKCELEPVSAINTNIIGTSNLVTQVLKEEQKGNNIRFIHISSDAVYEGKNGSYSERSPVFPATSYGWSKLGAECAVNLLKNFCIIRTRFFDPEDIPFSASATDIYTSKIEIKKLVMSIFRMLESDFIGTINIGGERISDFHCHSLYKPGIKSCKRNDIVNEVPFVVPSDISMNISLYRKFMTDHINDSGKQ